MYKEILLPITLFIFVSRCGAECDCGTFETITTSQNSRIWNGFDAPSRRYPWYVHIKEFHKKKEVQSSGGTLISKKHVLTCAHCVKHITSDDQ